MKRLAPGWSELTSVAPARSQDASSSTVTAAAWLGWTMSKTMLANPEPALTSLRDQPAGSSWTQGTAAAVGTAWAISHSASWSEQRTSLVYSDAVSRSVSIAQATNVGTTAATTSRTMRARPNRRRLKRWLEMGAG